MKKHKHISDTELDRYLDRHGLDLEINMLSPQGSRRISSNTIVTCRFNRRELMSVILEGIPSDEEILNMIKPIVRGRMIDRILPCRNKLRFLI